MKFLRKSFEKFFVVVSFKNRVRRKVLEDLIAKYILKLFELRLRTVVVVVAHLMILL